jgi:hypothetical protein
MGDGTISLVNGTNKLFTLCMARLLCAAPAGAGFQWKLIEKD